MKGSWTANSADRTVVAADSGRTSVVLQLTSGGPVYLGLGVTAVAGEGVCLTESQSFLQIAGRNAKMASHMRCPASVTAAGGYQTL